MAGDGWPDADVEERRHPRGRVYGEVVETGS